MIRVCHCENKQQDKFYGRKRRVFNMTGGKSQDTIRCTTCGTERSINIPVAVGQQLKVVTSRGR